MATFSPSPIIGSISGRIGGVEFAMSGQGNILRPTRRRARPPSPAQSQFTANIALFAQIWHEASPALRSAWTAYARSKTSINRFGQQVPLKAYKAAFSYHMYLFQWFNMVVPTPVLLQPPPSATPKPGSIVFLGASFDDTPSYVITSIINDAESYREFLWAGPARNTSWGSRFNWRFIGSQEKTDNAMDWTSFFTDPPINWVFQAGQILWIQLAHSRADYLTGLNLHWSKPIMVTAA